jgi:superfamily II DNA or RNA helicase
MELRPYEADWLRRIHAAKSKRLLIVGPTGSGKTVVAAQGIRAAVKAGKKILFLAHRRELVTQVHARLVSAGVKPSAIGVTIGMMAAAERVELPPNPQAPIQIGTIQSFTGIGTSELPPADIVYIDEAHHAPSEMYQEVIRAYPKAAIHGLTATPFRYDGLALDGCFDEIVQSAPPSALIEAGWLSKPSLYTVPPDQRPKLLSVRKRDGDFDNKSLARVTDLPNLIGSCLAHYKKHAGTRPTVIYGVNIAHCEHLFLEFVRTGIRTALVTGQQTLSERIEALERFENGDIKVLVNCQILTEGWDCPSARCAIIARPTLSPSLWFQMVGRVTRPGPVRPIILDHAGNALMHGLPLQDQDYTLNGKQTRFIPPGAIAEKACPACGSSVGRESRLCNYCGHSWWEPGAMPETEEGNLVPFKATRYSGFKKCAYSKCPKPNVSVDTRAEKGVYTHQSCKALARDESYRYCTFDDCPIPTSPLQGSGTMHRSCNVLARGDKTRVRVTCSYQKCPRPQDTWFSTGAEKAPMHAACMKARTEDARVCQYHKCPQPTVLLGRKALSIGTKMHRKCAADSVAERKGVARPACIKCGAKQRKLTVSGLCLECNAKPSKIPPFNPNYRSPYRHAYQPNSVHSRSTSNAHNKRNGS